MANKQNERDKQGKQKTLSPEALVTRLQNQVNVSPMAEGSTQMDSNPQAKRPTDMVAKDFNWTLTDLCQSVNGEMMGALDAEQKTCFTSISTDTRTLKAGALYIAIKGEHFDGHKFIKQAIQQGAVAVLVSDLSEALELIVPGVLVEDTRLALGSFAKWHRLQMPLKKLIAITGSNGKTTTKTLLLEIFQKIGNTLATEGNLNNDFGVPRTLLNLRPEHEYAIIEMGANHPLEIAYLTHLALPDIALINNASGAHLEGFGSLQGVIDTKGEIFQGLNQRANVKGESLDAEQIQGVAVINCDSPGYRDWCATTTALGIQKVISFGAECEADVRVSQFKVTSSGIRFDLGIHSILQPIDASSQKTVEMPVLGQHNALNAAACVAVALNAGLSWSQIQPGLVAFKGVAGRLQKQAIESGWLIDDSYNANPASVKAGIESLTSLPGLAILCLGAMAELGGSAQTAHQEIAEYAKQQGVDFLLTYGVATQTMSSIFGPQCFYFESHTELSAALIHLLQQQTAQELQANVLVKGSRSAQMERVTQQVIEALSK